MRGVQRNRKQKRTYLAGKKLFDPKALRGVTLGVGQHTNAHAGERRRQRIVVNRVLTRDQGLRDARQCLKGLYAASATVVACAGRHEVRLRPDLEKLIQIR